MKKYIKPNIEVEILSSQEVIMVSGEGDELVDGGNLWN